jgi:DNA-binding MarR family transcriptional regulator
MPDIDQIARAIQSDCACTSLRQTSRVVSRLYDELLRPAGLQASQLPVLVAVVRFGESGARISALADVLGMDRTTLSRNLVPLEKQGLVRVARAPEDARARVVLLTRAGERALEKVFPLWQRAQHRLRDLVGTQRLHELREGLSRVSDAVSAGTPAR